MCLTCGCGQPETLLVHSHDSDEARLVRVEQDILAANDRHAQANRQWLETRKTLALNLVSSPGSGKTTLLVRTLRDLTGHFPMSVIEGDQQTGLDAQRIRETGTAAVQINTGKACHLDAHGVGHALEDLNPSPGGVLFIENVGNLICPAGFDLGEAHKVVVLSVTEGDDKPLKYPDMFHACGLLVINKIDLLPYVDFDVERCMEYARRLRRALKVIRVSATTGVGLSDWYAWIEEQRP